MSPRAPPSPRLDSPRSSGPSALGGAGLGAFARALVLEELGAADAGAALALDPLGPAFYALAECGEEAALRAIAQPLLERPDARAALAWNGAARVALRDGRASGVLPWVPADRVDLLVLLDGDTVAVIDEGITLSPLRGAGLRAAGASELRLDAGSRARMVGEPARCAPGAGARATLHGVAAARRDARSRPSSRATTRCSASPSASRSRTTRRSRS